MMPGTLAGRPDLTGTATPAAMEPVAVVVNQTDENLSACHAALDDIEKVLHGPGPEQPKNPGQLKPLMACAFDCRTKSQLLHKRLSDVLANLAGR